MSHFCVLTDIRNVTINQCTLPGRYTELCYSCYGFYLSQAVSYMVCSKNIYYISVKFYLGIINKYISLFCHQKLNVTCVKLRLSHTIRRNHGYRQFMVSRYKYFQRDILNTYIGIIINRIVYLFTASNITTCIYTILCTLFTL